MRRKIWNSMELGDLLGWRAESSRRSSTAHVSRDGAPIPLMLQHYWWGEEALVKNGLPLTVLRANFFMNHLLKTDCDNIDADCELYVGTVRAAHMDENYQDQMQEKNLGMQEQILELATSSVG